MHYHLLKRILYLLLFCSLLIVVLLFIAQSKIEKEELQPIENEVNLLPQPTDTISIMTYNLGYLSGMTNNLPVHASNEFYSANLQKLRAHLNETAYDLVAFQEIDYGSKRSYFVDQHQAIADGSFPYSVKAINWNKRYVPFPYWPPNVHFGRMLSGQSTMSRLKIKSYERIVLEQVESNPFYYNSFYLDRLAVCTLIHHPVFDFWVINLHTEAFDQPTRKKQIEFLHQLFKQKQQENPVILLGDFNSSPNMEQAAIQILMNDSAIGSACFTGQNYDCTFPSDSPAERLDYIFYSKADFNEVESRILNEFGEISDHLPVYAKLSLRKRAKKAPSFDR